MEIDVLGILKWLLVTLGSAGIGAFLKYLADRSATTRKELLDRVKDIESSINGMAAKGTVYWCLEASNPKAAELAREIKTAKTKISLDLGRLEGSKVGAPFLWSHYMIQLHRAITDGRFEENGRSTEPHRQDRIETASNNLITHIRDFFKIL